MKTRISQVICCSIIMFLPVMVFSQNVDDIIAQHIAAHGGAKKWNEVETLKITGKFTSFSLEKDFTCYKTKSGMYYADFYLGEKRVIESIDGKTGWTIDPWQEMNYARNLNFGEVNALMQKAEFFTPFFNYKERGHKVEYTGKDTIDGIEVFVLKLTRTNDKVENWYLDTKTYLEYLCKSDWVDFSRTLPSEIFFDDFQTVDGLVIPFFTDRTFWQRDRILQIEEVEINPEVDESIFIMPRREEIAKLDFLEGEWNVLVEAWTRRGAWYNMGYTTSSIQFTSINMLQENITYERTFLISKIIDYTYNESSDNYRISMYNDLSSSLSFFEGEFNDTSFVFDDTNIKFGENEPEGNRNFQYVIRQFEMDSLSVERNVSTNGGDTWDPRDRFTYTRLK